MANETTPRVIDSLRDFTDAYGLSVWLDELQTAIRLLVEKINGHTGAKRNVIDNPDFVINQLLFNSQSLTGNAGEIYAADRHFLKYNCPGTVTYTRDTTDAPSVEEVGTTIPAVHKVEVTTADAMGTANEEVTLVHRLEGYDVDRFLWDRTCTLSFWVKTNKTGKYAISIHDGGSGNPPPITASYAKDFEVTQFNEWQQFSLTFDLDDTIGNWPRNEFCGMQIKITLASATTWDNGTQEEWVAGDVRTDASGRNNFMDTVGNIFKMGGMQLEVGSEPTEFMAPLAAESEVKCERYLFHHPSSLGILGLTGRADNATDVYCNHRPLNTKLNWIPHLVSFTGGGAVGGTLGTLQVQATREGFRFIDLNGTYTPGQAVRLYVSSLTIDRRP